MQRRKSRVLFAIAFLLCTCIYAGTGYQITVKATGLKSEKALLKQLRWDSSVLIDSSSVKRNGTVCFSGKDRLPIGEYLVRIGDKSFEFFISGSTGGYKASFVVETDEIRLKKGDMENRCFIDFQNKLENQWKRLSSAKELNEKIDSAYKAVSKAVPGSLLETFLRYSAGNTPIAELVKDGRVAYCKFGKSQIDNYLNSIEFTPLDMVIAEIDKLLSGTDTLLASKIAGEIFNKFSESDVMGHEGAAVYVADNYVLNGKIEVERDLLFAMQSFALVNRNSLIGMDAPELSMMDTYGKSILLSSLTAQSEFTLLYFYTDRCVNCAEFTPELVKYLNNYSGNISFYAVYTGNDRKRWIESVEHKMNIENSNVKVVNVWDPDVATGYHLLYGVVSTPKLFLIDDIGIIRGRNLIISVLDNAIAALKEERADVNSFFSAYLEGTADKRELEKKIDEFCTRISSNKKLAAELPRILSLFLKNSSDPLYREGAEYLNKREGNAVR